jgi:hypothetical protein
MFVAIKRLLDVLTIENYLDTLEGSQISILANFGPTVARAVANLKFV